MAILAFHSTNSYFTIGLNNYGPGRFENLLRFILNAGYRIVPLSDYIDSQSEEKIIALTFDDGYESFYGQAFPILSELNIPSTVFIPFNYIGKSDRWNYSNPVKPAKHLSADQIKELSDNGVAIESHGLSHSNLTGMADRMLQLELKRSKESLENLTGKRINFISYPFGRFNNNVECIAMESGYLHGFSLSFLSKSRSGFTIPRFGIYTIDTPYSVLKKIRFGPLNRLEKMKSTIINAYSYGTILLNKIRHPKS